MTEHFRSGSPSRLGLALAFFAIYVIWGSTYLAIRVVLESLPPFLSASTRFLTAGTLLYAWARLRGNERPQRVHWRSALIVGTLLFLCGNGGVVWAEQRVTSSVAALVIGSEPLWVVLLAWAAGGPRPGIRAAVGMAVGFAGVVVLVGGGGGTEGSGVDPVGAAVLLLSSLAWALGSVYSPLAPLPRSQLLSTGMTMLAGGGVLGLAGLLSGEAAGLQVSDFSGRSIAALAYLVVFGSIVAFSAYRWLLTVTTQARVSTYAYVNPVVAVLLGWAVAGEAISWNMLAGGAIIVLAVALIVTEPSVERRAAVPTPAPAPIPAGESVAA